jgi:hypothetical protein
VSVCLGKCDCQNREQTGVSDCTECVSGECVGKGDC